MPLDYAHSHEYSLGMDERPVHFEDGRYGETPHGMLGFHLRFTRMRGDVTCRRCLAALDRRRASRDAK